MSQQLLTFFPEVFRNSMLEDVFDCDEKWFWKNCAKYDTGTNPDLIAGGLFAKACELTRIAFYQKGLDMYDSIEEGETFILESRDTGHKTKSNEVLANRFKRYFQKFPLNGDYKPVELMDGSYAIEYKFRLELPILHPETNLPLIFQGTLDSLVWCRTDSGELEVVINDEKTTDKLSRALGGSVDIEKETNKYVHSSQLITYCWAARTLGVKVNKAHIMRVPMNVSYEEAVRLEIQIDDFMIDNWYGSMLEKVENLVGRYTAWKLSGDLSPRNFFRPTFKNDCQFYGRLCPFSIGCTLEVGETLMRGQFQQFVDHKETGVTLPLKDYISELQERKIICLN